jgi:hypothetical protein
VRPHLGPPRELLVRPLESDHRRAVVRLASATAIIAGSSLAAIALFASHARPGWRLVCLIGGVASAAAAWRFRRPSKRNLLAMVVLTWTIAAAALAMWT